MTGSGGEPHHGGTLERQSGAPGGSRPGDVTVRGGGGAVPAVPAAPQPPGRDMAPRGRPAAAAMPRRGARKRLKFRAEDVCSERGEGRAGGAA